MKKSELQKINNWEAMNSMHDGKIRIVSNPNATDGTETTIDQPFESMGLATFIADTLNYAATKRADEPG